MARIRLAALAIALVAVALCATPAAARDALPPPPSLANLGKRPVPPIHDSVDRPPVSRGRAAAVRRAEPARYYRASTGEEVKVVVSSAFTQSDSYKRKWADFLAGLVHGPELGRATVFLASAKEKDSLCSPDRFVAACYLPTDGPYPQMLVINLQPSSDVAPYTEEFAAHEYGHHIAWNRQNPPWSAYDFGTKRWASYENVCHRTRSHTAFPGDPDHYSLDPGEAFAEHYRVATGGNASLAARADVDTSFYPPNATDRRLIRRDVLAPWTHNTVSRWRGRVRGRGASAAKSFRTSLDGALRVSVSSVSSGTDFDLYLKHGRRTVRRSTRSGDDRLSWRVCGTGGVRVVVKRFSGRGKRFRVRFSRP